MLAFATNMNNHNPAAASVRWSALMKPIVGAVMLFLLRGDGCGPACPTQETRTHLRANMRRHRLLPTCWALPRFSDTLSTFGTQTFWTPKASDLASSCQITLGSVRCVAKPVFCRNIGASAFPALAKALVIACPAGQLGVVSTAAALQAAAAVWASNTSFTPPSD